MPKENQLSQACQPQCSEIAKNFSISLFKNTKNNHPRTQHMGFQLTIPTKA
jgi:hypothetical protein|tara:strand:- start:518 stop:670 length:153 start_codon:yes stop_codon:yes gene_type:complete